MSNKKKHPKKKSENKPKNRMWVDERDYTNDPFVLKKVARAKEIMEKHGAQLFSLL